MPRQLPRFVFCVCALLAAPAAAQQGGVRWQQDVEAAKAAAKQTGRLVLVHFWTPNCPPCSMLEQNVFNQPGVASAIEATFVPVKLNANEHSATAIGFGITRVPTDVILTPDGHVIGKLISPPTPTAYIAEMSQAATQFTTRWGDTYAKAAANAPMPSQLNSAYANLQINPSAAAAATAQASTQQPNQDRYAMAPTATGAVAGAGIVGGGAASGPAMFAPGAPHSVQHGAFAPWTNPTQTPATGAAAAPAAVPPQTAASVPAPVYNPYLQPTQAGVRPQNAVAPADSIKPPTFPAQQGMLASAATTMAPVSSPSAPQYASLTTTVPQTPPITVSPVSAPDPRALPPNAPPLGFEGYCPVSMRQHWKWVAGDPRYGAIHMGRTYWFAGPSEQQQFLSEPNRFSPALSGMDPVMAVDHRQQVPGKREHSIDYDNLFYMFSSEATLQQFAASPERYAASVRQAMGIHRGRLAR